MSKPRIFIDSDIIIDLFAKREHYVAASELLSLVERHLVDGYTTPIVLANVEYIIRKHSAKMKAKKALQALIKEHYSTANGSLHSQSGDGVDVY